MLTLYITDISDLDDPMESPEILSGLSENRKGKILRHKSTEGRLQSVGAGLLLMYALRMHGFEDANIAEGKHGKPYCEGICFNLSHSADRVICAIGDFPVGCDIEKIKPFRKSLAERFFTDSENAWLYSFEGKERDAAFFRLWTAKESYMKLTGEGFSLSAKDFLVDLKENTVTRRKELTACRLYELYHPDYCITVCSAEKDIQKEAIPVSARLLADMYTK